jgi:hypothetical protein
MEAGRFGPRLLRVKVEQLGLCTAEEEERWGVDQWVYTQRFGPGRPGIARVVLGCNLG